MRRKHWDGLAPNMSGTKVLKQVDGKPPEWAAFTGDPLDAPPPIGDVTPNTGAFTTLAASGAITSTVASGNPPFVVASTDKVTNLNADKLDGKDFADPGAIGGGTPAAVTGTTVTGTLLVGPKPNTTPVGVTATVLGDGAGIISDVTERADITSSVATKIVTLPTPTPGRRIRLYCAANGYELASNDPTNVAINNVAGAAKSLAVAAGELLEGECVDATHWIFWKYDALGATATAGVPN